MSELVIETRDLTKRYGKFVAVDSLNLAVEKGEIYGLLGPNGSGKTTTILMLLGLTEPSGGQVRVLGLDPVRQPLSVKARVGYLPDSVGFYDTLTAYQNLNYIARLNGLPSAEARRRIDAAIDRMGLTEVLDHRVKTFSRGMRQRLGVAELLLKQPQIIIMDEPTLGLDPEAVVETVTDYNNHVVPGGTFDTTKLDDCRTEGLEIEKTHWAQTIDTPPFIGYPLRPGITFTFLGVKVNDQARVLMADGKPSANIFASGEIMAGNILRKGYIAGIGMTIGTVFGRIAGESAARHARG